MNPITELKRLLNDGKEVLIRNYPKKYPPNIGIQYTKFDDIKKVLLGKGHDPKKIDNFITPVGKFFIRNHFEPPDINVNKWRLKLEGCFQKEVILSMEDLKKFNKIIRTVCFECTGNQRSERFKYGKQTTAFLKESSFNKLMRFLDPVQFPITIKLLFNIVRGFGITGGNFFANGIFLGVRLFDVLKEYPLTKDAKHIVFEGLDTGYDMLVQRMHKKKINYARSFELQELRKYEPILCFEMNGAPLTVEHGGPLRLIIPGIYGAEQVKWLGRINAITSKYEGYFQNEYYGYKIEGEIIPVHEQRPKSMVIKVLKKGKKTNVFGVAWRGRSPVDRIEVSIDGTKTWNRADLLCRERDNSWLFWKYELPQGLKGKVTILPRAFCENGDHQPLIPGEYSTVYGNNSVISAVVKL